MVVVLVIVVVVVVVVVCCSCTVTENSPLRTHVALEILRAKVDVNHISE